MRFLRHIKTVPFGVTGALLAVCFAGTVGTAPAAAGTTSGAGWSVNSIAHPTDFDVADSRDRYDVTAVNVGNRAANSATISDRLPAGVEPDGPATVNEPIANQGGTCSVAVLPEARWEASCVYENPIRPGRELILMVPVKVTSAASSGTLENEVTVIGGGAEVSTNITNPVNRGATSFGIAALGFVPSFVGGDLDTLAGDHPYSVTTTVELNTVLNTNSESSQVVQEPREVAMDLPVGFSGDPLSAERCPEIDLTDPEGTLGSGRAHAKCPAGSRVGTIRAVWEGGSHAEVFPLYDVVPENGYPAEFGFNAASLGQPIFLYASVVRTQSGDRLRIATPGIIRFGHTDVEDLKVTVFGDPTEVDGAGDSMAFVTNPTDCSDAPESVSAYATSWEGSSGSAETTAYPALTGCNLLQRAAPFDPNLAVEPETTLADTPSGYTMDLKLPQAPSLFGALATADLKNATITLPAGVSISPSAASGPDALGGCQATGREGINIGSSEVAPDGQDLGDPEATELGEGHAGGDGSSYDDGMWHTAPGHCPENSRLGEVEARTPDLSEPLHGHMYLMDPPCGRPSVPPCSEAEAEEGRVFHICLELSGSGVIVKLEGRIEVGGHGQYSKLDGLAPGQLRIGFSEIPQFPLEEVKVTLPEGPRAALANPQTCGTATTTSELEPSSAAPASGLNATPSSSFEVTGCGGSMPFKPGFLAGTATPIAGGYSPFVLQLTRQDGEQDLSGLEVTLPEGLLAKLSGVAECGEAEADAGTCSSASAIGTVAASVGAGSDPLTENGKVYLTGPYNGGPFGEVVVVPAVAGPFNFGNIVVRGSIRINPVTAQTSIVSNPLPTIVGGVLVRLRRVDAEINRSGFVFNPTDCDSQAVTGTVSSPQGATAAVSSPFAVTGCAGLPFKPSFTASTQSKTSRIDGASLVVKFAQKPGEANIHRVHLQFPKALPARLVVLRKACTEARFAANPAGCPEGSAIGTATAVTPVLGQPLAGPAYLVSHGNAAYPDVVFVLQGDGVTIELTGRTDIKKGLTYSSFETVPDAPVSSFEAVFPEGPHAVFGTDLPAKAKGSFCGRKMTIPTTIEGQNGAVIAPGTKLAVSGCPRHKQIKHHPKKKRKTKGPRPRISR